MILHYKNIFQKWGGAEYKIKVGEQKNSTENSMFGLILLNKLEEAESRLDDRYEVRKLFDLDNTNNGWNGLMLAIGMVGFVSPAFHSRLLSLIRKMVQKGGKELVLVTETTNSNALHLAALSRAPLDVMKLLVETADQAAIHKQNDWGHTPLHSGCISQAPVEVIEYMARRGGIEALKLTDNDRNTPLDILFKAEIVSDTHITALQRVWYELDPHCSRECTRKTEQCIFSWIKSIDIMDMKNNNFLKAFLNDRFVMHRFQMVVLADLYAQLGILLALSPSLIVYEVQDSFTIAMVSILSVCVSWLIIRELVQMYASTFESYSKKYGNYIDITQILLVCLTLHAYMGIQNGPEDLIDSRSPGVLICTTAITSVQILLVINKLHYSFSPLFTYAIGQVSTFSVIYEVSHPRS
jgi:hypothetical protein